MTADAKDQIVFVHGTGASNPADEGRKWWQLQSTFSNELGALQSRAIASLWTTPSSHRYRGR